MIRISNEMQGSAGLRYFGNEKFRKKNYFGKQKLQVWCPCPLPPNP